MNASTDHSSGKKVTTARTGDCSSLSGKTTLYYEFGFDDQAALHVRIARSSGTGFFSKGWVPIEQVQRVLNGNGSRPITCHTLGPLFKGQSVNTAGFLVAVLKDVGLVQAHPDNPRAYQATDGKDFFAELQQLQTNGTPKSRGTSVKKKTAIAVQPE